MPSVEGGWSNPGVLFNWYDVCIGWHRLWDERWIAYSAPVVAATAVSYPSREQVGVRYSLGDCRIPDECAMLSGTWRLEGEACIHGVFSRHLSADVGIGGFWR